MAAPLWLLELVNEHGDRACEDRWGWGQWRPLVSTAHRCREIVRACKRSEWDPGRLAALVHSDDYASGRTEARRRNAPDSPPVPASTAEPKRNTVEVGGDGVGELSLTAKGWRVRTLDDLLEAAEVDLGTWAVRSWRANTWEVATREGVRPVWQVRADLERKRLPARPARPARVGKRRPPTPRGDRVRRALFVPDSQHGFRWADGYRYLDPLHDRAACDVVVQLAARMRPDVVVLLGDMADLAAWSTKFPRSPELKQTTQPTIDELHWWLAELRDAAPEARIVYCAGNHEDRIRKMLNERADEAGGLRAVGDDRDALDWARLLHLDGLDIEYAGPYGADWWLWDQVRITHGGGTGSAAAMATATGKAAYSTVQGHVHRLHHTARTLRTPDGTRIAHLLSPGCLCRLDGSVPGSPSPDWQHGIGVGYLDEDTGTAHLSTVPIVEGRVVFDGVVLEGEDRRDEIAEVTGWTQINP